MNQREKDYVGLQWDVGVSLVVGRPATKPAPEWFIQIFLTSKASYILYIYTSTYALPCCAKVLFLFTYVCTHVFICIYVTT